MPRSMIHIERTGDSNVAGVLFDSNGYVLPVIHELGKKVSRNTANFLGRVPVLLPFVDGICVL
jgi:hypothetical protein